MSTDVTITIRITSGAPPAEFKTSDQASTGQEWDLPLPSDIDGQQGAFPPLPDDELENTPDADIELPAGDDHADDVTSGPEAAPS